MRTRRQSRTGLAPQYYRLPNDVSWIATMHRRRLGGGDVFQSTARVRDGETPLTRLQPATMYIHIGTVDISLTRDRGDFFCPVCREQVDYVKKVKKRFLAVYFIPLIPLEDVEEFAKCRQCRKTFDPSIPDIWRNARAADEQQQKESAQRLLRMMVLAMIADGHVDDRELQTIHACYERAVGASLSETEVADAVLWANHCLMSLCDFARANRDSLSSEEKHAIVRSVFLVATSTESMSPAMEAELAQLPTALGISEEVFRNVVEEAAQSS